MSGLINVGRSGADKARLGLSQSAEMENNRNMTNKNLEEQHKQGRASAIATGATAGAVIGGPLGMAAGAAIGWASTELF